MTEKSKCDLMKLSQTNFSKLISIFRVAKIGKEVTLFLKYILYFTRKIFLTSLIKSSELFTIMDGYGISLDLFKKFTNPSTYIYNKLIEQTKKDIEET